MLHRTRMFISLLFFTALLSLGGCFPVESDDLPRSHPDGDDDGTSPTASPTAAPTAAPTDSPTGTPGPSVTPNPTLSPSPTPPTDADSDGFSLEKDCDDNNAAIYPGAVDLCNGLDDDCDGQIDNGADRKTYYKDGDGDGYGDADVTTRACSLPTGYVTTGGDCDDVSASVHPGATEVCNGVDDNCEGRTDEGVTTAWFPDVDLDGYGDETEAPLSACEQPEGYVTSADDCNDEDASSYPGAFEDCDGVDHNCSGTTSVTPIQLYPDADLDGYGNPGGSPVSGCEASTGWSVDNLDCADSDAAVHPVLVDQVTGSSSGKGTRAAPLSSIQKGIDYQTSCALVVVNPGTYTEALLIQNRSDGLVLRSAAGAAGTVLQAGQGQRPLGILSSTGVTVQGLSIHALDPVNGLGAGLYVGNSSGIQLTHLVVHDSITANSNNGGGIGVELSSDVYIGESTFTDNNAEFGAGVTASSSNVTISYCTFTGNQARDSGGGAASLRKDSSSANSKVIVDHCTFTGNYGYNVGGAAGADQDQDLVVSDSTFEGNVVISPTFGYGGALYNPSLVQRCIFTKNLSTGGTIFADAGALMLRQNATVSNCIFMGNEATYAGAVDVNEFSNTTSSYKVINNTFVDNKAYNNLGESLYVYAADSIVIRNNVTLDLGGDNSNAFYNLVSGLSWVIEYNDFYVDAGKALFGFGGWDDSLLTKNNNKALNPKFVSYSVDQFSSADLHLGQGSPCINTGNPAVGLDPDGTAPDMGAYGGPGATW